MGRGRLFVISGASGVGKSTVLSRVMAARKDLSFSVSATTREPRPGEMDGVSYYFVSKAQFEQMIAQNAFLEFDNHAQNYYGTPRRQLEEKLLSGHVILDIEPNGAAAVRKSCPEAVLIFIMPPSVEELERRLCSRGDTSPEQIALRMDRARWEMDQRSWYDHVVVNDEVLGCADKILQIIAQAADQE